MGDLNKRRGRVLGMNPVETGKTEITADVPYMEIYGYMTDLLHNAFFKRLDRRHLERHFGRIHWMVRTIVKHCFYAHDRIRRHRSFAGGSDTADGE